MKRTILSVLLISAAVNVGAQDMLDFDNILHSGRAGAFFSVKGDRLGIVYSPLVSKMDDVVSLNVGGSYDKETNAKKFLASIAFRVDILWSKLANSSWAGKNLKFAVFPKLEVAPAVLTANFKEFIFGGTVAYKF